MEHEEVTKLVEEIMHIVMQSNAHVHIKIDEFGTVDIHVYRISENE